MTQDLLPRLEAAIQDRYRIERPLGSGGMATVYLAQDLKHERQVAVKVLRPELAAALGPERFHQEIKIAANLTHPHILPLHDSGDADGFLYYVMPHVEGESLRDKLAHEGELPIAEGVRILRDVVDALSHAHKHGVVHRDIKPDNILLSERHALVTDFGVAKAVSEATGVHKLTTEGVALGTPAYMSPEQAVADKHIDHRADIYAVGVLAYELLTGRPPFTGTTPQEVLSAQVTQAPEPVTKYRAAVPPALAQVVMKCLEKKAADRWQSAEELLPQLEALATPSGGVTPTGMVPLDRVTKRRWMMAGASVAVAAVIAVIAVVAVAPRSASVAIDPNRVVVAVFDNETGNASLDPVGRLAAEWITQGLQSTGIVDVVPSPTALQASQHVNATGEDRAASDPVRALAEETGAGMVVSGAYYHVGDSIQFQAQITDARASRLIHALDPVAGPPHSPREPIGLLRERVMGSLAASLDDRIAASADLQSQPPSFEAYRNYSDGMDLYLRREYAAAVPHFYRAASQDSTFHPPLILAAFCLSNIDRRAEEDSVLRVVERSREQLAPYDRYSVDGLRASLSGDRAGAYRAYRSAAKIAPGSKLVYNYAREARRINRPREAVQILEQLDPERGPMRGWIGYWSELTLALHMLGDYERELQQAQRAREFYPQRLYSWALEMLALAGLGRAEEIVERLHEGSTLPEETGFTLGGIMREAAAELEEHGQPEAARQLLDRAIRWYEARATEQGDSILARGHVAALYFARRWDETQRAAEVIVEAFPDEFEPRALLGVLAARRGDAAHADSVSEWLRTLQEPYLLGSNTLYRARISAILNEHDQAVRLLQQAFLEGRSYPGPHADIDFESLRDYPPFQELIRPKG